METGTAKVVRIWNQYITAILQLNSKFIFAKYRRFSFRIQKEAKILNFVHVTFLYCSDEWERICFGTMIAIVKAWRRQFDEYGTNMIELINISTLKAHIQLWQDD